MSREKVTVIGAGQVGATVAHLLVLKNLADVMLIDIVEGLAKGKALDMTQAAPVEGFSSQIAGSTDMDQAADSRIVVITAGLPRKPGMSREDLLAANAGIVGPAAQRIGVVAPKAIIIVVTNPLDIMVALAQKRSGFPRERVIGMAGVLDSARLRTFIAERLKIAATDVEAMVLGSHGNLMVPVKNLVTVQGRPVTERLDEKAITELFARTRDGGAEIVKLLQKGSAFYAPASGVVAMAEAILKDSKRVLPTCVFLGGEYGIQDACIGVPARLGALGMEGVVEVELSSEELKALRAAAEAVRKGVESLEKLQGSRT